MLIPSLMGPIIGIGINDQTMIQRALETLSLAVFIHLLTSTVYFLVSPLHIAQAELLAFLYLLNRSIKPPIRT